MLEPYGGAIRPLESAGASYEVPALRRSVQAKPLGSIVRRRKRTLVLALAGSVGLIGGYTALQDPLYTSKSTILVEGPRTVAPGGALDALGRVGIVSQVQTEAEMLLSRRVVEPVVDELDLHVAVRFDGEPTTPATVFPFFEAGVDVPVGLFVMRQAGNGSVGIFAKEGDFPLALGGAGDTLRVGGLAVVPPPEGRWKEIRIEVEPFAAAVEGVLDRVAAKTDPTIDLVELSCMARDPDRARILCDEIGASYIRLRTVLQRAEASSTATFLGDQVTVVRGHLAAVEDSLERYALAHRIVALEEQASEEVRRLAALEAEQQAIEREHAALAALVNRTEAGGGDSGGDVGSRRAMAAGGGGGAAPGARYRNLASFPTFLQQGAVTSLVTTLVELENQRLELTTRRQESSPDVRALDIRIAAVEGQLGDFAGSYLDNLESRSAALGTSLAASMTRIESLPSQQVAFARLERQAALLGELFGFLETRRREAEVAEQVELPSVRILDHASAPFEPTSPSWAVSLLAAVAMGLGGGLAMAFYQEYSDPRIRGRREVEIGTGLHVLSIIPSLPRAGAVFEGQLTRRKALRRGMSARREEVVREAFRGLLTDLEFLRRERGTSPLQTIAVVSAGPGEGKTFTASNIALARASVGANTLLVDADMRAGGVSEFFGIPTLTGLSEVLSGDASLEDVTRLIGIEKANVASSGSLAVLPAGSPTSLSAALLQGTTFERILAEVRDDFDMVIIDTPPLNVLSDAMPVAAAVDGVLLVVRGGRTDREGLELALDRLRRAGANVIGVVLNDSEVPRSYGVYNTAYALET